MYLNLVIADDNKDFTEILSDYLDLYKDLEIRVLGLAYNGIEALDMVERCQPDILILDMLMPTLDGMDVLRNIKAKQFKKVPRIICLTALENHDVIAEALTYGVEYYIEKPFNMAILISKIRKIRDTILLERQNQAV